MDDEFRTATQVFTRLLRIRPVLGSTSGKVFTAPTQFAPSVALVTPRVWPSENGGSTKRLISDYLFL
jgi:hypothetical protein